MGIPDKTIVTGPDTFAGDSISCDNAKSFDPSDKVKILNELTKKNSVNEINEYIKEFRAFGASKKTVESEARTTPATESVDMSSIERLLKKKDEELKKKDEEHDKELKKKDEGHDKELKKKDEQ